MHRKAEVLTIKFPLRMFLETLEIRAKKKKNSIFFPAEEEKMKSDMAGCLFHHRAHARR